MIIAQQKISNLKLTYDQSLTKKRVFFWKSPYLWSNNENFFNLTSNNQLKLLLND